MGIFFRCVSILAGILTPFVLYYSIYERSFFWVAILIVLTLVIGIAEFLWKRGKVDSRRVYMDSQEIAIASLI